MAEALDKTDTFIPRECDWDELYEQDMWDLVAAENLDMGLIEEGTFTNKTDMLNLCGEMMKSIYVRAVIGAIPFLSRSKEFLGTEFETNLRPVIRKPRAESSDTDHFAVEMVWARIKISQRPATAADKAALAGKRVLGKGQLKRIVTRNGQEVLLTSQYLTLKRGKSLSYPKAIFKNQPDWVRLEGEKLEELFTCLRKECAVLTAIRRGVSTMHFNDVKYFEQLTGGAIVIKPSEYIKALNNQDKGKDEED